MALSEGGASLISSGVQVGAEFFFGKGARKEQEKALKAQRQLVELQQQEQRLRNQALSMSLSDRNDLLPFSTSLPGRTAFPGVGANPDFAPTVNAAGFSGTSVLLIVGVGAAILFALRKAF